MVAQTVNFDTILDQIDPFGPYQIYNMILLGLAGIPIGAYNLANVFLAGVPKYWCAQNFSFQNESSLSYTGYHMDSNTSLVYQEEPDACQVISNSTQGGSNYRECDNWIYDDSVYTTTIVTKWNLVCSSEWKVALAQSIYMLGFLVGAVCFGNLSDVLGRQRAWFMSLILMILSGTTAAFMPGYYSFIFVRMLSGIAAAGSFTVGFVMTIEVIGVSKRLGPGIFYQGYFALGYMILPLAAYFIQDYKYLQLLLGLVPIAFLPYYWLLKESPRWLLAEGKYKHAEQVVTRICKMNKKPYPSDLMGQEATQLMGISNDQEEKKMGNSVFDLLRTPNLRRNTLNTFFNWFVNSFVYYGLSMGSASLPGGPYINLFVSGLMEFPGYIIAHISLAKIGRRWPLAGLLVLAGLCCFINAFVPDGYSIAITTFSMLGKLCISGSFAVIYVFSAELCPTVVRNVGVGAGSMSARIGGLTSPFVGLLGVYWKPLPLIIFGALSITAGTLTLLLPETLGQHLPDTLEEGEHFGKISRKKMLTSAGGTTSENLP